MPCLYLLDEADSDTETEGAKIDDSLLLVPGSSLLKLLSKCQRIGCPEQVLPSNIKVSRKGRDFNRKHCETHYRNDRNLYTRGISLKRSFGPPSP